MTTPYLRNKYVSNSKTRGLKKAGEGRLLISELEYLNLELLSFNLYLIKQEMQKDIFSKLFD